MKKEIHPPYQDCAIKCVCGNSFVSKSTRKEILVEVCSACHPVYTGKQKIIDTTGRVDRFKKMMNKKEDIQKELKRKPRTKRKKKTVKKIKIKKRKQKKRKK